MPKKAEPITKEYFEKALNKALRITKRDLNVKLVDLEKRIDRNIDLKLEFKLEQKFEEKLAPFRKEIRKIFDTLDWLVGAFKKFDEEHTFHSSRIYGHEEQLENHEVRIGVLEKKAT